MEIGRGIQGACLESRFDAHKPMDNVESGIIRSPAESDISTGATHLRIPSANERTRYSLID